MELQINFTLILSILGIHALAVSSPGPDFVLVTKNSLHYSRKTGVYTAIGIGLGLIIHIGYSLMGLGFILTHNRFLFRVVQILGGSYLAYLGLLSFKSYLDHKKINIGPDSLANPTKKDLSWIKAIQMGFITNLLNPKVGVFFISIFTQFFHHEETLHTKIATTVILVMSTIFYFSLVSIGITIPKIKELYLTVEHKLELLFALILILFAVKVIFF